MQCLLLNLKKSFLVGVTAMLVCVSAVIGGAQDVPPYETPPVFQSEQVLSSLLLSDPSYRVQDTVPVSGMFFNFSVWSRFNWYYPASLDMLYMRIAEIEALEVLDEIQKKDQFFQGIEDNVVDSAKSVGHAVSDPVGAVAAIPQGVGKFMNALWAKVEDHGGGRRGKETTFGFLYAKQKRKLALQIGVDPYSDNEELQNALNNIAANRNFGHLTVTVGTLFIPGVPGLVVLGVDVNRALTEKLVDNSPSELQVMNRETLKKLGCDAAKIDAFLSNDGYSTTNQTTITYYMEQLHAVSGIERYLECIQHAPKVESALYHQRGIQMAAAYDSQVKRLVAMDVVGDLPVFTDSQGVPVFLANIDYLSWNPWLDQFSRSVFPQGGELWTTGLASQTAQEVLSQRGITIHERADKTFWPTQQP